MAAQRHVVRQSRYNDSPAPSGTFLATLVSTRSGIYPLDESVPTGNRPRDGVEAKYAVRVRGRLHQTQRRPHRLSAPEANLSRWMWSPEARVRPQPEVPEPFALWCSTEPAEQRGLSLFR